MARFPTDTYSPVPGALPETEQPTNDYIHAEASPQAFGSQIGQATEKLGQAGQQIGGTATDIATEWQNRINQSAVSNAYQQFQTFSESLLHGDPNNPNDQGYLSTLGETALNGRQAVMQKFNDQRQQILGALQNDVQRMTFDNASRRLGQVFQSQVGEHSNQQFRVYSQGTQSALQQTTLQSIGNNFGDDASFQNNLANGIHATQQKAELAGLSPEETQAATQKYTAQAYQMRAESMAATDPSGALAFVQKNWSSMDPLSGARLIERLKPKVDSDLGKATGQQVWQEQTGGGSASPSMYNAIFGQESGNNPNVSVSSRNAHGLAQITPGTFKQYARPGESIDNPADNKAVGQRIIDDLSQKFNGDPARIAVGYFSGPNNVAPPGSPTPWKEDKSDGNTLTSTYVHQVLGRLGSGGAAVSSSTPSGQTYPDVSAGVDRIMQMTDGNPDRQRAALSEYEHQVNLWRLQTQTDRQEIQKQFGDAVSALEAGKDDTVIPEADIRRNFPPAEANDMLDKLQTAKYAGQVMKGLQWASPDDVAAARADLSSGLGTRSMLLRKTMAGGVQPAGDSSAETPDQFNMRQRMVSQMDRLIAQRNTALSTDPAGYAAANPTVQSALKAIDPNNPATFEQYARTTTAVQQSLGVAESDTRVLSEGQAQAQAKQLMQADPATTDVGAQLDHMAQSYGDAWPQVWHDLVRDGHMPGDYQILAQLPAGPDRINMQRALQAANAKGGAEGLRKLAPQTDAQTIDQGLDDALSDFRKTVMVPGLGGSPELYASMRNAVRTTALYNALNGQDGATALHNAVSAALPYDFEGMARAPKGEGDLASSTGASILNGLKPNDLAVPRGGAGMADADKQTAYLRAVQRGGTWVTNERGDGWMLVLRGNDGSYVLPTRSDGSRIEFNFRDMEPQAGGAPLPMARQDGGVQMPQGAGMIP